MTHRTPSNWNGLGWVIGSIAILSFITIFLAMLYPSPKISDNALSALIVQLLAIVALIVRETFKSRRSH